MWQFLLQHWQGSFPTFDRHSLFATKLRIEWIQRPDFDSEQPYTRLIQKVSTVSRGKKSSKFSYKILLLSDSTFFKLFFHIFAAIIEALILARHKFLYTLLIECGRLRC